MKSKKLLGILLTITMLISLLPTFSLTASAATIEGQCGTNATYTLTDDGVLTVSGTGAIERNAFGSSAENYATLNKGFKDYLKIQKVVINEGITEIGNQTFNGCSSITSVALPSTITKIQDNAFFQCTNLKNINLPEGLTYIGTNAFYQCKKLTEITIPSTLTYLGNSAFQNCTSLKTVVLSEGMTATISKSAFAYYGASNTNFTQITIPASVTKIADEAFFGTSALKNITIKNKDITLGTKSFFSSDIVFTMPCNFDETKITASVVNNKSFTFSSDYLHIDANNDGICDGGCGTATVASVSLNTNSITLNAVGATETLTATITPSNVTADLTWRSDNYAVASVSNGVVTAVGAGTATITVEAGGKTAKCTVTVSLPENPVTGVSLSQTALTLAVNDTYELDAIIEPENADIKTVTWSSNANNIATVDSDGIVKAVSAGSANITVTTQDGEKTATCAVTVLESHEHTWDPYTGACGSCSLNHYTHGTYEWNSGSCSVCGVAGGYCGYVGTETSVEYILTSTDTGNTYTLTISGYGRMGEYIDYNDSSNPPWYDYRTKITSVIIQNGVNDIGWGAFKYHTALQSVSIPSSVTEIKRAAFLGASSLTSITLPDSITNIGQAVFKESGLTSISIPSGVTKIQGSTFSGCTKLASVKLSNNITEIEGNAFQQCTALTSINIPNNVMSIGEWAFNQSGLTAVTIPASVTSLEMHAFSGCPNLKTVTISGTNLTIAERAFQGNEALEALTINNTGNVTIRDYAFMIDVAEDDDVQVEIGDVVIGGWENVEDDEQDEPIETQSSTNSRNLDIANYTSQSETIELRNDRLYTITLPASVTYTTDYATSFKNRVRSVDIGETTAVYVDSRIKANPAFISDTAFDKTLTWSSDNAAVAKVDANGIVTGISAGSATITATSKYSLNGEFRTDTCVVTVLEHPHEFTIDGNCSCGAYEPATDENNDGVYEISNAGQLYWYAQQLNENNIEIHVKLVDNIVIPETAPNWVPISASYAYFDGNFKTISGLKCIGSESDTYVGMFGNEVWWYDIKNLHITDSYFEGNNYVGAVVAVLGNGGSVTNCYVTNTTVKGDSDNVGTLVGYLGLGHIINCFVDTDTLVGYDSYGNIENSYYLSESENENGGKTVAQFTSGEVAYLLQGGILGEPIYDNEGYEIGTAEPEHIWGQNISVETYPVFGGDKVYLSNGIYHNEVKEFKILSKGTDGGKATATVAVPTAGTYTLIFADYEDEKLNSIDTVTVTAESDKTVIAVSSEIDITLGKDDKIMLWQDMTNLVPLCEAYIVK